MELINLVVNFKDAVISFDVDSYIAQATELTAKYQNLIVSENNTADAKKDLANLRKFTKAIDDRRKEIKSQISEPIKEFEVNVKRITSVIDPAIENIDNQLKEFEEREKTIKKLSVTAKKSLLLKDCELREEFKEKVIIKEQYLNKTFSIDKVTDDIKAQIFDLLYQQKNADMAQELERQKLANRELLIANLCAKYGVSISMAQCHGSADEALEDKFIAYADRLRAKAESDALAQQSVQEQSVTQVKQEPAVIQVQSEVQIQKPQLATKTVKISAAKMEFINQALTKLVSAGFIVEEIV